MTRTLGKASQASKVQLTTWAPRPVWGVCWGRDSTGPVHHDHLKLRAQVLENCTAISSYEYMCGGVATGKESLIRSKTFTFSGHACDLEEQRCR